MTDAWHKYGDTAERAAEALVAKLEDRIRQVDALYAEHKMLRNALKIAAPLLEQEAEQRETSGNDEYSKDVREAADLAHSVLARLS